MATARAVKGMRWAWPAFMRGRNGPDGLVQVELVPFGIEDFAGPGGGEDGELQRQCRRRFRALRPAMKAGRTS